MRTLLERQIEFHAIENMVINITAHFHLLKLLSNRLKLMAAVVTTIVRTDESGPETQPLFM